MKHEMPFTTCPVCNHVLTRATNAGTGIDSKPEPGDYTVCIYCHFLLVFNDDYSLRTPTEKDIEEMHLPKHWEFARIYWSNKERKKDET